MKVSLAAAMIVFASATMVCQTTTADIVGYTNVNTWLSDLGEAPTVEEFTGLSGSFNDGKTIDVGDFTLTGYGDYDDSGFGPGNFLTGIEISGGVDLTPSIGFDVLFDQPTRGFGFNHAFAAGGGVVQIEVSGETFQVGGEGGFLGVIADTPFSAVRFSSAGLDDDDAESFIADRFRYATVPVPEPSSVWLLFSGCAGLGMIRRRRGTS